MRLSWNCQEFENSRTVNILNFLIKKKSPKLVFLMQTRSNNPRMETVKGFVRMDNCLTVPSIGFSGGLALM